MALVHCHDCGAEVSNRAPSCVKCGAPLQTQFAPPALGVVTTQDTAKKFKGLQLLGALLIAAGVVSCVAKAATTASGLMLLGLVVYLGARFAAWWNHS